MSALRYYAGLGFTPPGLPAPLYAYRPDNAQPSSWTNTGTAGSGFDLLPEAGTVQAITGPNGVNALRMAPGVSMQTTAAVTITGTQPRTLFAVLRLSDIENGALLGWGAPNLGQLFDLLAYQLGLQIHVYGDQRMIRNNVANQWLAFLCTGQVEGGTFILRDQVNGTLTPTDPAVNTAAGTLTLGRGRFSNRSATLDIADLRIWDTALTAEERGLMDAESQALYDIPL